MKQYPDFGKWLTYIESVKSATGIRKGVLDNTPTEAEYANMARLYKAVYEPLCNHYGFKLPVTSFFRNKATNRAVGGSKTSDHLNGNAIDIDCDGLRSLTNNQLFDYAKNNLDFHQIIEEYPDANGKPSWIHLSYRGAGKNRKQVLTIG